MNQFIFARLKRPIGWLVGSILVFWSLTGSSTASDVPFVPTPQDTVEEMLTLAGVGEGDLVYDLGSGDGRIIITAAEMGARGVGIDIDPERVREGEENAAAAGVSDRVAFLQQDLFDASIRDATVVTLYLLPSVNLRLRPKLLEELRPGTRVVSYSFDMGAWQPDLQLANGREIYLWIVPANFTGTWRWSDESGEQYEMRLNQEFQNLTGSIGNDSSLEPVLGATLAGDLVEIVVERNSGGRREEVYYLGQIAGDLIEGRQERADGTLPWRAVRESGTETVIDGVGEAELTRR